MGTTRTYAGGATLSVRGTPDPEDPYEYAAVLSASGPYAYLLARSVELAAADVLATRRTASWQPLDDRTVSIRFTRGDPAHAAAVTRAVLDRLEERFEEALDRADDDAFDRALLDDGDDGVP